MMRRLHRWSSIGFVALSLLGFAGTAALWIASIWTRQCYFEASGGVWNLGISSGHVWVTGVNNWPRGVLRTTDRVYFYPNRGFTSWRLPGCWGDGGRADVATQDGRVRANGNYWNYGLMFWLPLLAFAIAPAVWIVRAWRFRRINRDTNLRACSHCRYDLTGNVSGVCPECGSTVIREPAGKCAA